MSTKKTSKQTKAPRETKAAKIKRELDDAMPVGFSAGLHQNPLSKETEMRRYAESIAKGGGSGGSANGFDRKALEGAFSSAGQPFVSRTPLLYVDPMFDPILFLFPKDRIDEINKRLRHYYETDPIVGNAVDLHTALPLTDFELECEDPEIQDYWNDFKQRTDLLGFLRALVHDYWLLGEGIGLPIWDPHNFEFSHFNQYPPENVDIERTYVTPTAFYMLKPDPKLAEKVQSGADVDKTLMKMMPKDYVQSLQEGRPYLLGSDKSVIYLARNLTKYRHRGVSILARALKDLLYKDKLRLLQLTFVDRHMFPIKIFKLGSEQRGWIPNKKHFDRLQKLLAQASNDPDFNLIYHFGLQVDYVGTKDKIWNLIPEFEWVERQVMAALFVSEEVIHGGIPSAVRDTVNMRTLMHRYLDIREKIELIMVTHIFLPIAQARGFYKKGKRAKAKAQEKMMRHSKLGRDVPVNWHDEETGKFQISHSRKGGLDTSVYDIPRPMWKKINLVNNITEQQLMMKLEEDGKMPLEMVFDMLGIDYRVVKQKMKAQASTEFDPLWRQIREEIGKDKNVRTQVFKGTKPDKWSIPTDEDLEAAPAPADKAKKQPAPPAAAPAPGKKPVDPKQQDKKPNGAPGSSSAPATRTPSPTDLAAPGPLSPVPTEE